MSFPLEESAEKANQSKNGEKTTVIVGVKVDDDSREILTWTLVNVAQEFDRVIALHVLPAEVPDSDLNSIVSTLNAMMSAYDVFCNLKQIDFKVKISRGSSVRRVLSQEARLVLASKLVVGVSKCTNQGLSYFSISIAKYCAKKLSCCGCLVLAVNNGKIVFQGKTTGDRIMDDIGTDFCKISEESKQDKNLARRSFYCVPVTSRTRLSCRFNYSKIENIASQDSQSKSLCSPVSSEYREESFNEISTKDHHRPGWSLFRRAFLSHKKNSWSSISPVVHPDHKSAKSDETARSSFNGVSPVIHSFDVDDESKDFPKELLSLQEMYSSVCRVFSYKELEQATSNFSSENIIGKGGNSRVYKGCIFDNKELAVKVLEPSDDVLKNFISEIEIMSNLHHKNIISLTGFCFENKSFVLVYDFLSRGSLEDNLHNNKGGKSPVWDERYMIAVGVAEALEFLHESCSPQPVIHRDVKSSNILLSDDFEPQLSDFGLARFASPCGSNNTSCSDLEGTFGYLAPECFTYGEINEKVDVYAFGVVLLELLSGRKPVCTDGPKGEESLVLWAKPILRAWKPEQVLDPCFGENYNTDEMERLFLAASLCIREAPAYRPSIALVLKIIKGDDEAVKWAKLELGSSILFDDMDDEATIRNLNMQSHINLAFLGVEDEADTLSAISRSQSFDFTTSNISTEEYLKERWSHSLSFN